MKRLVIAVFAVGSLTFVMLTSLTLIKPGVVFSQKQQFAKELIHRVEQDLPDLHPSSLDELSKLGDASIGAMVHAASGERGDLALLARRDLDQKLAFWQELAATDREFELNVPLRELAAALSQEVERLGPVGQKWARSVVLVLADLAQDLSPEQATEVLSHCSLVLQSVPAIGPRKRTPEKEIETANLFHNLPDSQPDSDALAVSSERIISRANTGSMTEVAGGNAPLSVTEPDDQSTASMTTKKSNWIPNWLHSKPANSDESDLLADEISNQHADLPDPDTQLPTSEDTKFVSVPSPAEMERRLKVLRKLSTWRLFEEMSVAQSFERATVGSILTERGFQPVEFELGIRIVSPDPQQRLALIEDLQVLPAGTARKWLRELLFDPDAEVRFQALSAIATTQDPQLAEWAREIAAKDTDARIVALASRIVHEAR